MNHYQKAIEWAKKNGFWFVLAIPDAPGIVITPKGKPNNKIVVALTGEGVKGADIAAIRKWGAEWYNSLFYWKRAAKGAILEFKHNGEAVFTEAVEYKENYMWVSQDFAVT